MELKQFFDELRAAVVIDYVKTPRQKSKDALGTSATYSEAVFSFKKKDQKDFNCVNERCVIVRPSKESAHAMLAEEIWFGYDSDGDSWSDHMGGCSIDCTGMKCQEAIDHIVKQLKVNFKELFV